MLYRLSTKDISRITGLAEVTVKRQLKQRGLFAKERSNLPKLLDWLYPRLVMAEERGVDTDAVWDRILKERAAESEVRKKAAKANYKLGNLGTATLSGNRPKAIPDDENRAQEFPKYEEMSQEP